MRQIVIAKNQGGTTLVEVLVAIALTGIMLPALATAIISSSDARPTATQQLLATGLMQQLVIATRSIREQGWGNIVDGTYHPVISGSSWALASGAGTSGNFSDQIVISDVQRNISGDVVSSGGTLDPSTKLVTTNVSWNTPTHSSVTSSMYLSRWQNETAWAQTSQADFTAGTLSNTVITNTSGGEVQLGTGQTSGTFESSSFDAGTGVSFNYFSYTANTPSGTNIEFQIASNNDNATWNFVGPDGTSSTFFTSPSTIPLSAVSGRYFRYEATLTATSGLTPVLEDVALTYSP